MEKKKMFVLVVMAALTQVAFAADQPKPNQDSKKTMTIEEFVNQYSRGLNGEKKLFDEFFSDGYFKTNPDPFRQMESIHGMMRELVKNFDLEFFERSFNDWYNARLGIEDLGITTEDKKDKTIINVRIPGLEKDKVETDINDKRIKISGSYDRVNKVNDNSSNIVTSVHEQKSFFKILQVPVNSTADDAQVKVGKDVIIITLNKKKAS